LTNRVLSLCLEVLLAYIFDGLTEQTFNLDLLYVIHVIQEHYACLSEQGVTTPENRTTTRHMALPWLNN
jgi:hypothetical protein